jgi:hypothetical protein
MPFDTELEEQLPRKAYFKVGGSINKTILKKELIQYPADKNVITVRNQPEIVRFLISGDCLLDGRESFFSLKLKTNTFTGFLSGDITSIISKIVLRLPSNSNIVLEEIDSYNTLSSLIQMIQLDDDQMASHWESGLNMLSNHNRAESQAQSRRFLNLNESGYRFFTFQMNLSSILFHEQYLPLSLLNGILLEVHLAPSKQCFHYNPANETWAKVFGLVDGMFFDQGAFNGFSANKKTAIQDQLIRFYNRPAPNSQEIEYEVEGFTFNAAAIWMNAEYVKRLTAKATGDDGINIFFNTFRFNQIAPEQSSILHFNSTEQFQNLKRIYFATLNRNRLQATNEHSFNSFDNFIKSYKFRIGSRSWQVVNNEDQGPQSYTQTLLSLGGLQKQKTTSIKFTTYPRTQNIHVFDFEKVQEETHSGEDTTNGRNLRMEINFQQQNDLQLLDEAGQAVVVNGNALMLKRSVAPNQCVLYFFQYFTKMMNISSKGIAITE